MDENNMRMEDVEKEEYSFNMLLNDILPEPNENNGKGETGDDIGREYGSKLIVIQMLKELAESYKTEYDQDDNKFRIAIENKVTQDELLSGYLFFVSQNPQFDYSWSYLRKCKENYKEFLLNSIRFLNNVINDINMLVDKSEGENIHVVFHDILDVELSCKEPFAKTRLLWENFNRLMTVKNEYNIIVKTKEAVLKVGRRTEPSDMENLIDSAMEMINNNITKKNTENRNETD